MDQATARSTDPSPASSRAERRRRLRHRPHSPIYASFKTPQAGVVVDLSELLDLNEDGFAVHTAEPLEANRPLTLTLDLPETGAYIHGNGVAVWSDTSGRGGIRFSELSDASRRVLKEWLFADLLVACANHSARSEQRSLAASAVKAASEESASRSALEALRQQLHACGDDSAAALNLITDCALEWTEAGGAALALLTGERMTCRARSGDMAPPLGAAIDVNHGLSGECIRSHQMVSAEDTENDPHVDREACRALGIGSILAVPVMAGSRILGLLEVFSPFSRAFTQAHQTLLHQLIEVIPTPQTDPASRPTPPDALADTSTPVADAGEKPVLSPKEHHSRGLSRNLYLVVMALVAVGATLAGYLSAPVIQRRWLAADSRLPAVSAAAPQTNSSRPSAVTSPEELRRLAEAGDAESQYWIGIRYGTGANVIQNDIQAAKWFERAAAQGHVQAQARIASYYWSGRGVPKDLSKAYFWASLAWAQGDENSKLLLEGLSSQMTRSQVAAARQQADNWLHRRNQALRPTTN
jgi:GAF domain-containing protein/Sel1 repeat-containing protein/PilZ domain-containing protein